MTLSRYTYALVVWEAPASLFLLKLCEHDYTCAITAPTGIASFNVGEITVHLLFKLPFEREGRTAGYWSLPLSSQKILKVYIRYVKVIVVDDVSMLSSLNVAYYT